MNWGEIWIESHFEIFNLDKSSKNLLLCDFIVALFHNQELFNVIAHIMSLLILDIIGIE